MYYCMHLPRRCTALGRATRAALRRRAASSATPPPSVVSLPPSSPSGALAAGVASGLVQGSMGSGGSIVMVAGLMHFSKLAQVVAAGTSMPTQMVAQAAALATVVAADASLVHLPTAACLVLPALGGVVAGVRMGSLLSDAALKLAFAALVLALVPPVVARAVEVREVNRLRNVDEPSDVADDRGAPPPWPQQEAAAAATTTAAATTSTAAAAPAESAAPPQQPVVFTAPPPTTTTRTPLMDGDSKSPLRWVLPDNWEWPQYAPLHCAFGAGVGVLVGAVGVGVSANRPSVTVVAVNMLLL
jgi:uncharacterized membrane protein YfcA